MATGLPAQVSMCPICMGVCAAGGKDPAFMGLLFLWGQTWQRWHPGCLLELVPYGVWVTWRWEPCNTWGRGSGAGAPKEGIDLVGWRNDRKTSVSEESEQGDGRDLVSEQWAGDWKWDGMPWMVQSRGAVWSDVGVKRILWWSLEGPQQKRLEVLVKPRRQKCGLRIGYQFLELL